MYNRMMNLNENDIDHDYTLFIKQALSIHLEVTIN